MLCKCICVSQYMYYPYYECGERKGGGGSKKEGLPFFSSVTSANVGINPQHFLTFSLTHLPYRGKTLRPYLAPFPNNWHWTKMTSQKSGFSGLLVCHEYTHVLIVLHRVNSHLLVSIQRYFNVVINYHALILSYIDKLLLKKLV